MYPTPHKNDGGIAFVRALVLELQARQDEQSVYVMDVWTLKRTNFR